MIVGTGGVAGLVAGAATTLGFTWTPATVGNHDLVARQTLSDHRAVNDQRLATIPVEAPLVDVAVSGVSVPGAVIEGHTANVALGTQTVPSLVGHASVTRTFTWNLTVPRSANTC